MQHEETHSDRTLRHVEIDADLVVVGGGMAGVCAAITAAREGCSVTLIQDRPVLGGNASSEVRLWVLGATSHGGNNNRWAREGGIIDELLLENLYRNPEGNPLIWDSILLEKASAETRIRLLLNTPVYEVEYNNSKEEDTPHEIRSVLGFCSQNETHYRVSAALFVDASGDGILGFLSGAAFRMGEEAQSEFGEALAPAQPRNELLGHSLYFYTKDTGTPVRYTPPSFALRDITKIPRYKNFGTSEHGCRLWWIEYGGLLDTIHETETIKWELWRIVYGVWDYIKNSGNFPEAATLTLEWVGTIPGKRESRRFEGDYILTQHDIVEQREHRDVVSYGGWAVDLHPAEGVYSPKPACSQWHAKGIYPIPYRCLYSRNVTNLFLAGRIISATHVAFGSTRVMATCAHNAQAVGMSAALCIENKVSPITLSSGTLLGELQKRLLRIGQFIPQTPLHDEGDLIPQARLSASSILQLGSLKATETRQVLDSDWALLLPLQAGKVPAFAFCLDISEATELHFELRTAEREGNFTPDRLLSTHIIKADPGVHQKITADFDTELERPVYCFVCITQNPAASLYLSEARITGVLALKRKQHQAAELGFEGFDFWTPLRRPAGKNFAVEIQPPIRAFEVSNLSNGIDRPTNSANAWVASFEDAHPSVIAEWDSPKTIARVHISFDTDFDHPLESVLMGHPERVTPFCVRHITVWDDENNIKLGERQDNPLSRWELVLKKPTYSRRLRIVCDKPNAHTPASLFALRCYSE